MQFDVLKRAKVSPDLLCYSIVRNESYFLPHFLDHYRKLGIEHFIFYDDHSTDGSREMLLEQEDCTVLTSGRSFRERMPDGRPFLARARTIIPEQFGAGGWALTADADEFLLLPEGYSSLREMIGELERRRHICVMAPMVDLYPERLSQRLYPRHLSPFDGCDWWFDRDPGFVRDPVRGELKPVANGIRPRLLQMLAARDPARVQRFSRGGVVPIAKLWKVPLLKMGLRIEHIDSHSLNVTPPLDVQLAFAHFNSIPISTPRSARQWNGAATTAIPSSITFSKPRWRCSGTRRW